MGSLLLNKLQPGKTYTVLVRALDSDGNKSANSVTYTFTTPTAKLDGTQLTSTNTTVVTALANDSACVVGGALTAGGLDANGLLYAGRTNLASIWNSTSAGPVISASLTGTASAGAVIINSTGILGYQFSSASQNAGQAQFLLNTADGNAYFRGTVYAKAGQIGTSSANSWYIGNYDASNENSHGIISTFGHVGRSELPPFNAYGAELDSEGYLELYSPSKYIWIVTGASSSIASGNTTITYSASTFVKTASGAVGQNYIRVTPEMYMYLGSKMRVYGTGIPANTYITNGYGGQTASGYIIYINNNLTASFSGASITFGHPFFLGDNVIINGFSNSDFNKNDFETDVTATTSVSFTVGGYFSFTASSSESATASASYPSMNYGLGAYIEDYGQTSQNLSNPGNLAPPSNGIYFRNGQGYTGTAIPSSGTIYLRGFNSLENVSSAAVTVESDNTSIASLTDTGTLNIYSGVAETNTSFFDTTNAARLSFDNNTIQSTSGSNAATLYINQFGGNIVLGYGTSSANNSTVYSPAIRYNETVTTASKYPLYILQSGTPYIYTYTSHFRSKNNINSISNYTELSKEIPLEKVSEIRSYNPFKILNVSPVSFNSVLDTDDKDKLNIGFIVEDIAEKVPELSSINEDGEAGMYNLDGIVASMLAVIQDQQKTIENLEQRLALLENK